MKNAILSHLPVGFPWKDRIAYFETVDSTNTRAKELAAAGAPHGTVLIAGHQTGGRGRLGRSFQSPAGKGVYLSVILRPECPPQQLMHLTCAAAVAMCEAVQEAAGFRPGIKWTNDLVCGGRKLGGILTELSIEPGTGLVQYAIVGIGINCTQQPEDFSPEIRDIAASLSSIAGKEVNAAALAAAMIFQLYRMDAALLTKKAALMEAYRKDCITLGQDIVLVRGEEKQYGTALDIDEEGGLLVRFRDGNIRAVTSGEISVRGMYGYL